MYQNKSYTHNMLHYRTAHKPITRYDKSDLNMWKTKMFVNTLAKKPKTASGIYRNPI